MLAAWRDNNPENDNPEHAFVGQWVNHKEHAEIPPSGLDAFIQDNDLTRGDAGYSQLMTAYQAQETQNDPVWTGRGNRLDDSSDSDDLPNID